MYRGGEVLATPGAPLDDVQKMEQFTRFGEELQILADLGEDVDAINALTDECDITEFKDRQVSVSGGLVQREVPIIGEEDDELDVAQCFVPNDKMIIGRFDGWTWCKTPSDMFEDRYEWRLCHAIQTGMQRYKDRSGNRHTVEEITYVTVAMSSVDILGQRGSHDLRVLHDDEQAQEIDMIALDEAMDLQQKLDAAAEVLGEFSDEELGTERVRKIYHRLSYLNHLRLFDGALVETPVAYVHTETGLNVIANMTGRGFLGVVEMVGFDAKFEIQDDDSIDMPEGHSSVCLEINTDEFGLISAPYIAGRTRIA